MSEENNELKEAMKDLTEAIDALTAANREIYNQDTSTDDLSTLRGKMSDLIKSNEELKDSIKVLTQAIREMPYK